MISFKTFGHLLHLHNDKLAAEMKIWKHLKTFQIHSERDRLR